MPQRAVKVSGIGEVTIVKRRNSSNLRLTIDGRGKVKVSMPYWTPYAVGVAFVKSRADWIVQRVDKQKPPVLYPGAVIGRNHRLYFRRQVGLKKDKTRVKNLEITITSSQFYEDASVQAITYGACERALKIEAQKLLPGRLNELAGRHGYRYGKVRIRKLTSRWGSCTNKRDITLSYFLVQLPPELIDYVILHELIHTKHLNHGRDFWGAFMQALPNARVFQKRLRSYYPRVEPA